MIPRVPRALATLAISVALIAACEGDLGGGGGGGGDGGGTPNVISGRVMTEAGTPVPNATLRIVGYTGGGNLGQAIGDVSTDANGAYSSPVPNGLYEVLGQAAVQFDGQTYLFDLDPADASCDQQLSDDGIVKDFVLRLTGPSMCSEGMNPDNHDFYHGAAIQLFNGLSTASPEDVVEYTLEPMTTLADGSTGETLVRQRTVGALTTSFGPIESTWILHDIPLARYSVSATLVTGGGDRMPLLVSTDAQSTPSSSAEVAFEARTFVGQPEVGYSIPSLRVHEGT